MRNILFNILKAALVKPLAFFQSAYIQSLMIIQPVNFEADGRQDMCDSCPDITVQEGKLIWSCRLEELNKFGAFVQTVPKSNQRPPAELGYEEGPSKGPDPRSAGDR
jgi:hypothetical protein